MASPAASGSEGAPGEDNPHIGGAFQLVAQGLLRVQEALTLQAALRAQETLHQQEQTIERKIQEALRAQEQEIERRIQEVFRVQEEKAASALREAVQRVGRERYEVNRTLRQQVDSRIQQVEDKMDILEARLKSVAKPEEADGDASDATRVAVRGEGSSETHEANDTGKRVSVEHLERRMESLEAAVQRAVSEVFPRVDSLLMHAEWSARQNASQMPPSSALPTGASTSQAAFADAAASSSTTASTPRTTSTITSTVSTPRNSSTVITPRTACSCGVASTFIITSTPWTVSTSPVASTRRAAATATSTRSRAAPVSANASTSRGASTSASASGPTTTTSGMCLRRRSQRLRPREPSASHASAPVATADSEAGDAEAVAEVTEEERQIKRRLAEVRARWHRGHENPSALGENLCSAVYDGRQEDIRRLLDSGADANYVNLQGYFPLISAFCNYVEDSEEKAGVVALLLERGAEINAITVSGWSALHAAAFYDTTGLCVGQLLAAGADVNARDEDGVTPLHRAALSDNPTAVRALLWAGARKALKAWGGRWKDQTPFDLAVTDGVRELLRLRQRT